MKKKRELFPDAAILRREAEARLSKRKKRDALPAAAEADTLRLLHELQVHQIELEMQNEELAISRAELEKLLRQYTDLYDFAPIGYFTLARDGEIQQVNLAGAALLGVERGKLIKRRFGAFVSVQSRSSFNGFLEKVFENQQKEMCEIELLKGGADLFWVHIDAIRTGTLRQTEACDAVVRDITERMQADDALRHLSTHDALTGLYNRHYFMEEMQRLERGRVFPVSILMADVDYLKEANDHYGHDVGDVILKCVAQALTHAFRAEDVVARIGGDEFAVLLPATGAIAVEGSLQRLQQVIQEHNSAHPATPIHLSLGVSTADTPALLSEVLKEADANMYLEKRRRDRHS